MLTAMQQTRRGVLAAGLAGLGATSLSGCLSRGSSGVSVLAAGSLHRALDSRLRDDVGVDVSLESRGSAACARMVHEGLRDPDLLVLADPALFTGLTDVYTSFATNALVVAYDPTTAGGRAVRDVERPYDALLDASVRLGRTDPDADPLGYRTLFSLGIAESLWGRPYTAALDPGQLFPETDLLATFETGSLDAAVVYRNMAVDHGVPFRELPPALDLSTPAEAERYASQTYELPSGQAVRGSPIEYGVTMRGQGSVVESVFETLVAGGWLGDGFEVPSTYPSVTTL